MSALKIGELAKLTGLTVRALHHYDAINLLKPSTRTPAGHRVYTKPDILRLEKILSLQQLGLSLDEIKEGLQHQEWTFHEVAKKQIQRLESQNQLNQKMIERLKSLSTQFENQESIPQEELIQMIRIIVMYEKYYTPEQLETLKKRQKNYSAEEFEKIQKRWDKVFAGIQQAFAKQTPVTDADVVKLGKEANALIDEFTGNDPQMKQSLDNMYNTEGGANVLQGHGLNITQAQFDYLKQAMVNAK